MHPLIIGLAVLLSIVILYAVAAYGFGVLPKLKDFGKPAGPKPPHRIASCPMTAREVYSNSGTQYCFTPRFTITDPSTAYGTDTMALMTAMDRCDADAACMAIDGRNSSSLTLRKGLTIDMLNKTALDKNLTMTEGLYLNMPNFLTANTPMMSPATPPH